MYQAYVVQKFGDDYCNIILGDQFGSIDAAYNAICTYENNFGKCVRGAIEPAGKEIPTHAPRKKKISEILVDWFH